MIPATGPRTAAYPPSQPKIKVRWFASNFHGIMATPAKQVITPPTLKVIRFGHKLEKSLAGETTFAPIFTFRVASRRARREITTATGEWKRLRSCTGSQIAEP